MSYRSGLQMFAIMTNWKTHKPLTRPGVKHGEEMSICSSTPQAHRGYINSSLLESDLKMSESHANARGGYSHTLAIRVCAAQRGRDFEAPDLERGIHFRGVF